MNEIVRCSQYTDLVDNPTPRVPVCLCLDTSFSMGAVEGDCKSTGETVTKDGKTWTIVTGGQCRIEELEKGIQLFRQNVLDDEIAKYSAEVCIVTFNDHANCVTEFTAVDGLQEQFGFIPEGETAMGEGVNMALDMLEARKKEYQDNGVDYYQPWLILMTDGAANGSKNEFERACQRVGELVKNKKLSVFPIAIGDEVDLDDLEKITMKKPLRLKGLKFKELFAWLSKSISVVSNSMPGEKIKLDTSGFEDWASLE